MRLFEMLSILKLSPLFQRFRERVERRQTSLEESVKILSLASELVLLKVRWLLPSTKVESQEDEESEEIIPVSDDLSAATALPVMEPWEVESATRALQEKMQAAALAFPRGHTPEYEGGRELVVVNVDPLEVRDAMLAAMRRTGSTNRVLLVPRISFVTHLRDFWREVRRLTARGAILRFSRFLGKTKQEAILNFLAFLELVKRRRLFARQRDLFGEIEFSIDQETVNREGDDRS